MVRSESTLFEKTREPAMPMSFEPCPGVPAHYIRQDKQNTIKLKLEELVKKKSSLQFL